MSSTRSRSTTKRKKSNSSATLVTNERKKEIFGLILLALAFLVTLAILTHSREDDALLGGVRWSDLFDARDNRTDNLLGPVGAITSRALVPGFLGFPILGLVGMLFAWGYVLFRRRKPVFLPMITGLAGTGVFFLACFFGWVEPRTDTALDLWSGAVGLGVAGWLEHVVGAVGSFALLTLALAVTILLFIDRDIQTTLDRVEEWLVKTRDGVRKLWASLKTGAAERKELRKAAVEERKVQQDSSHAEQKTDAVIPKLAEPVVVAAAPPTPVQREVVPTFPPIINGDVVDDGDDQLVDDLLRKHQGGGNGPAFHIHSPVEEETADLDRERKPNARTFSYTFPSIELLKGQDNQQRVDLDEIEENKQILLDKLDTYNIEIVEIDAVVGPTVTRYELTPAAGVKISRITALQDDLAMALAAPGIRIIAPIPGKSAIGVEIPNRSREMVRLRSMLSTAKFRDASNQEDATMELPVAIGKTIEGEVFLQDLTSMPHVLVAGATGSGKSVGVNTLITGLLYACHPADLKFVMIDPKKIELNTYAGLLDHFIAMPEDADEPITTDFAQAAGVLKCCEREMEERYDLLASAGVRGITEYNAKVASGVLDNQEDDHRHLPYIVVVIDELADLMMTSGKEVEAPIARLAQMARAVGIHLVIATQRPSVDVITGLIKANFPSRVAYQVASRIDSRTIIDMGGAQHLIGNGDLLYMNGSRITRLQGPFISVGEVEAIVNYIQSQKGAGPYPLPPLEEQISSSVTVGGGSGERDVLFEEAARVIVRSQQGSVSLLQRKLSVGYTRAARLVDQLEDAGIVGSFEGSKARDVLVADEMQLDALLAGV